MVWILWVACQVDPLAKVGLEPTLPPPPAAAPAEEALPELAAALPADAVAEPAGAPKPPPAPPPAAPVVYEPISVPMGPRTEGGVRWKGVSSKFSLSRDDPREIFDE